MNTTTVVTIMFILMGLIVSLIMIPDLIASHLLNRYNTAEKDKVLSTKKIEALQRVAYKADDIKNLCSKLSVIPIITVAILIFTFVVGKYWYIFLLKIICVLYKITA